MSQPAERKRATVVGDFPWRFEPSPFGHRLVDANGQLIADVQWLAGNDAAELALRVFIELAVNQHTPFFNALVRAEKAIAALPPAVSGAPGMSAALLAVRHAIGQGQAHAGAKP
jgi:hypothetical protein